MEKLSKEEQFEMQGEQYDPGLIRKWSFGFEDEEGIVHEDIDYNPLFVGTDSEAEKEGVKRSNQWEQKNNQFCYKIIRYSQGVIR